MYAKEWSKEGSRSAVATHVLDMIADPINEAAVKTKPISTDAERGIGELNIVTFFVDQ